MHSLSEISELLPRQEGGASLQLLRFYAVIALWHRALVLREFSVSASLAQTYIRFAISQVKNFFEYRKYLNSYLITIRLEPRIATKAPSSLICHEFYIWRVSDLLPGEGS